MTVGFWFLGLGAATNPKPTHFHVQSRLEALVPANHRRNLGPLLDLDQIVDDEERRTELLGVFAVQLEPLAKAGTSFGGLATEAGQRLLMKSLIDGYGQRFGVVASGKNRAFASERPAPGGAQTGTRCRG